MDSQTADGLPMDGPEYDLQKYNVQHHVAYRKFIQTLSTVEKNQLNGNSWYQDTIYGAQTPRFNDPIMSLKHHKPSEDGIDNPATALWTKR